MSNLSIKNKVISDINFIKNTIKQGNSTTINFNKNSLNISKASMFVGINNGSPSCQLDISGNINATSVKYEGNDISSITNIKIGIGSGQVYQQTGGIAIGYQAGQVSQGTNAISTGYQAGQISQGQNTVAIGTQAGQYNQSDFGIAMGYQAGQYNQGSNSIAIGYQSGQNRQDSNAIAIGYQSGQSNQNINGISIGWQAGQSNQSQSAIAIGYQAGQSNQGSNAIAIGQQAGQSNQGSNSIAIGAYSGIYNQGSNSIAIGAYSGISNQGSNSITIGYNSGISNQGNSSIIIGNGTGNSNVPNNTILINPTVYDTSFTPINPTVSGLYISPIRTVTGSSAGALNWNSVTGEVAQYSGKTFIIQHHIKKDRYLVHACLEGPENSVYYRGQDTILNESIDIKLPSYASKIAYDFTIQLTPVLSTYFPSTIDRKLKTTKINKNGIFTVSGNPGKFNWLVIGKRNDIIVEPFKKEVVIKGQGPYTYIE